MKLGRVIGNVVSAKKVENLVGIKLLVVDYLNYKLVPVNKTTVCTDTVSAGVGDLVLLCSSSSSRFTTTTRNACTDNSIVGIVTSISVKNKDLYDKAKDEI